MRQSSAKTVTSTRYRKSLCLNYHRRHTGHHCGPSLASRHRRRSSRLERADAIGPSATPHAQVVFGRDLDGSNDAVKDVRDSAYFDGAAGSTTRQIHGSAHPFELPPKKIPNGKLPPWGRRGGSQKCRKIR